MRSPKLTAAQPTKGLLSVEDAAKQIKGPKGTDVSPTLMRQGKQVKSFDEA